MENFSQHRGRRKELSSMMEIGVRVEINSKYMERIAKDPAAEA